MDTFELKNKNQEKIDLRFYNNFFTKFPGGFFRENMGKEIADKFDEAAVECGLDLEEIKQINEKICIISRSGGGLGALEIIVPLRTKLIKMLIPVYIKLLEQGYTHKFLVG